MSHTQINLAGGLPWVLEIDIFEWLVVSAKGQGLNYSNSVGAGREETFEIHPATGYDYLLYHAIQWGGIIPGTVTFDLRGGTNSITAGFAMDTFIQNELFITDRGRPIRVHVTNASGAPVIFNIDYVALPAQVWERECLPFISPVIPGGH